MATLAYEKTIAPSELRWGILKIPKPMRGIFPKFDTQMRRNEIIIEVGSESNVHLYDNDYGRIRGMKALFVKHKIEEGDLVQVETISPFQRYRMRFSKAASK